VTILASISQPTSAHRGIDIETAQRLVICNDRAKLDIRDICRSAGYFSVCEREHTRTLFDHYTVSNQFGKATKITDVLKMTFDLLCHICNR
jgi:hypothetical protein